jgi:hypothetical protein
MDATATVCPKCGKTQPRAQAAAGTHAGGNVGAQIGASATDALNAFLSIIVNPVGGLAPSYSKLGPTRALGAGGALCVIFALLGSVATLIGPVSMFSSMGLLAGFGMSGFGMFLRALVGFVVLAAAMIAACFGLRKVLSGQGPLAADVFTVGAAVTPAGIAALLSSFLGAANFEIQMLLTLFAMSYLILMLYGGLTRLCGLTEKAAAPAVPGVLAVSFYICSVVFRAMISSM